MSGTRETWAADETGKPRFPRPIVVRRFRRAEAVEAEAEEAEVGGLENRNSIRENKSTNNRTRYQPFMVRRSRRKRVDDFKKNLFLG